MNLAEAISTHGRKLGPFGTAVLAFVVSNPGCTYDQIAEGLDMGRSTVIRYVHQLESLSLTSRHTQKRNGLDLATSIKTGVSLIDSGSPQRDTTEEQAPSNTGVPLRDTEKTGYPAEIHREYTPLHPHKDILNTNTLLPKKQVREAQAPTGKKTSKKVSQKDPRTNYPAIRAYFTVTKRNPPINLYDKIIKILGPHPNVKKLQECYDEWTERGNKKVSLKWLTEWYVNGIPAQPFSVINGGNNGQSGNNQRESKNVRQQRENYRRFVEEDAPSSTLPHSDGVQGSVPATTSDGRRDGVTHQFVASGYGPHSRRSYA
jgi:hypothetical protein